MFAASESTPKHIALARLIRGTSFVADIAAAILLILIMLVPATVFFKAITDASKPFGYRITMFLFGLGLSVFYLFIVKRSYHNFRNYRWELNAKTVANFSSVFALFLAIDWYHILPPYLPQFIAEYCKNHPPLVIFVEQGPGPTYRLWLSWIAFYVFYHLIKTCLMQILDLNDLSSPKNLPNHPHPDPDIPEFPQKSPLVQL